MDNRKPKRSSDADGNDGAPSWLLAAAGVGGLVAGKMCVETVQRRVYQKLFRITIVFGCIRFGLLATSWWLMGTHRWMTVGSYVLSCALKWCNDELITTIMKESSGVLTFRTELGSHIHALADRFGDIGLLSGLCVIYPNYMLLFMMIIALDTASHSLHAHSYMMGTGQSYKVNPSLLQIIPTKFSLFNEMCLVMIYLCNSTSGPQIVLGYHLFPLLAIITGPSIVLKIFNDGQHLWRAAQQLATSDLNSCK